MKGKDWKLTGVYGPLVGVDHPKEKPELCLLTPLTDNLSKFPPSFGVIGDASYLHFSLPKSHEFPRPSSMLCSSAMPSWIPVLPTLPFPLTYGQKHRASRVDLLTVIAHVLCSVPVLKVLEDGDYPDFNVLPQTFPPPH